MSGPAGGGSLLQRLEAAGPRLVDATLARMLENPFWAERFGERARTHGREDGLYHVRYLVAALEARDAEVLRRYATWLRTVLVSRGMSSRHLAENFTLLSDAIAAEGWPDAGEATAHLHQAEEALLFPPRSPAGQLQREERALAEACVARLYAHHPSWSPAWRARCVDDVRYHVAYLADALGAEQPPLFASYVAWAGGFLARRGVPRAHLDASLVALGEVLPAPLLAHAQPLLAQARRSLAEAPAGEAPAGAAPLAGAAGVARGGPGR